MTDSESSASSFRQQLKNLQSTARRHIGFYKALYRDSRTPKLSKAFFWMATSYLLLPFDLIPDFIPVLGQIDDAVIVPLLLYVALRMVSREVLYEHRAQHFGS